ncbi:MAG TPA: hypothetical protein VMC62_03320 [Longilinea sp.]|nr:hypothetical protein [Longilinea sp.]
MEASSDRSFGDTVRRSLEKVPPATVFLGIILFALVFFEFFNYSTTDYALRDLLGGLNFAGLGWSTILAMAFCAIDFAGIARLFTPRSGFGEGRESWYLFGAWLLAATMNAMLTWWSVSLAIVDHSVQSAEVINMTTLTRVVPVFVAIMVWVIRILIIGSLSYALDRFFNPGGARASRPVRSSQSVASPAFATVRNVSTAHVSHARPAAVHSTVAESALRPEPTYHAINASRPSMQEPASVESRKL